MRNDYDEGKFTTHLVATDEVRMCGIHITGLHASIQMVNRLLGNQSKDIDARDHIGYQFGGR